MNINQCQLISLSEHCYRLSNLLGHKELSFETHYREQKMPNNGEHLDWLDAREWLRIASSIVHTEVDTTRFDESVQWCRSAWEYESERSKLLSFLTTELAVFSFIWGALETLIKVINPPRVPANLKPRASDIDRAIYFLKTQYEPSKPIPPYQDTVGGIRQILKSLPDYGDLSETFRLEPFMGISGVGLHVVRKIRNRFAHGTMRFPSPEGWGDSDPPHVELIQTSCRIVLLSIQMLLDAHFRDDQFLLDGIIGDQCPNDAKSVHFLLGTLHIQGPETDKGQPILM